MGMVVKVCSKLHFCQINRRFPLPSPSPASGRGEKGKGGSRTAPTKPIGRLIGAYKTVSTKQANTFRQTPGMLLWQRNYWERIVRDAAELLSIQEYICNNPAQWAQDKLHPQTFSGI